MEKKIKVPTEKQAIQLSNEWAESQIELKNAKKRKEEIEAKLKAYAEKNGIGEIGCVTAYERASPSKLILPAGKKGKKAEQDLLEVLDEIYINKKLNASEIALNYKEDASLRTALRKTGITLSESTKSIHFKYIQKS